MIRARCVCVHRVQPMTRWHRARAQKQCARRPPELRFRPAVRRNVQPRSHRETLLTDLVLLFFSHGRIPALIASQP
jgi:hypothetical protein